MSEEHKLLHDIERLAGYALADKDVSGMCLEVIVGACRSRLHEILDETKI